MKPETLKQFHAKVTFCIKSVEKFGCYVKFVLLCVVISLHIVKLTLQIMSYHEKENWVNIFSSILITGIFAWMVWQRQVDGRLSLESDYRQWGMVFLVFMGVSIVARIIIYIIFAIINTIAMRKEEKDIADERVKLIRLKAIRNSHYSFSIGFGLSVIALAIGMPVYGLFIAFVGCGMLAELIENGSQIYYNRKGV